MKMKFPKLAGDRWPVLCLFLVATLVGMPRLLLSQEIEPQELYRQLYQAALADSVISPDEERMLETLERALGLREELVEEALGESLAPRPPGLDQSGRWTLVAQNMIWGAGLYGWGIPHVLDVDDEKWYVGGVMFSLGTSFYLTWKCTNNIDLPEARSQLQCYGGVVGLQWGRTLNSILGYWDNEELDRGEVLVLMGAVPAGIYLGDRLYHHWEPSTGQAYALSLYGELGAYLMTTIHQQIAPEPEKYEGEYPNEEDETDAHRDWRKERIKFQLVGYPLGTYLGHRLYGDRRYSFGDAAMLFVGRTTGSLYGFILADLLELYDNGDDMTVRWLVTAGGLGGVAAADRFIRGADYTFGQTALVTLGGIAGGGAAMGLGVVLEIEQSEYYDVSVIACSLGGFLVTRRIIEPLSEQATATNLSRQPWINFTLQPVPASGGLMVPTLGLKARW